MKKIVSLLLCLWTVMTVLADDVTFYVQLKDLPAGCTLVLPANADDPNKYDGDISFVVTVTNAAGTQSASVTETEVFDWAQVWDNAFSINCQELNTKLSIQAGCKIKVDITVKSDASCAAGYQGTMEATYDGSPESISSEQDPNGWGMDVLGISLGGVVTPPSITIAGSVCAGGASTNITISNLTDFTGYSIKVVDGTGADVTGNFTIGTLGATTTIAANTGTASGSYTVKLVKGADEYSATLTVGAVPSLTITPSNNDGGQGYFCTGGSDKSNVNLVVGVSGGTGYTYTWTKPDGSTQVTANLQNVATAGTYKVVATKSGSCPAEKSITVKELTAPSAPTINAPTKNHVCKDDGGSTVLTITPNNPAYTYQWAGTESTTSSTVSHASLTTNPAGNAITVKANDGKCTSVASANLVMYAHKLGVTLNPSGSQAVASGVQKTVTATEAPDPTGATITSWTWTSTGAGIASGDGSSSIQTNAITATSTYKVKITDQYGCTATSDVTEFTIQAGSVWNVNLADASKCTGTTITLSPSISGATPPDPISYSWTSSDGLTFQNSSALSTNVTTTTPGTYHAKITVTDGNNISKNKEVIVKIYGNPTLTDVVVTSTEVCKGDEVVLKANGGAAATTVIDNSATFDYVWTGATATAADPSVAKNTLNNGDNTFKVKIRDRNGCESPERSVIHKAHQVTVIAKINGSSSTTTVPFGSTAALDCEVTFAPTGSGTMGTYEWSPTNKIDGINTGKTATTVALTAAGSYTVKVKDNDGCEATDDIAYTLSGGALDVTAQDVTFCEGTTKRLACTPSGGTGGQIDYEWIMLDGLTVDNPNSASPTITTTTPGTYHAKVKIKQGGQTAESLEITVTINPLPKLIAFPATPQSVRAGNTVTLTGSATPGTATMTWSGSPVTGAQTGTQGSASIVAGTFTTSGAAHSYTLTAAIGECSVDSTVIINVIDRVQDIVIVGNDITACEGDNATISVDATGGSGGGSLTYHWEVMHGNITLSSYSGRTTTVASAAPGSYTVRVTVTDNSPVDPAPSKYKDINIVINAKPTITSIDVLNRTTGNPGTAVNFGDELNLVAHVTPGDATCSWSESASTTTLLSSTGSSVYTSALTGNNTYTVTASSNGCSDSKEVTVTVRRPENGALLELELTRKCADSGESMLLTMTASGGMTYSFTLRNNSGETWDYDGAGPWTKTISLSGQNTYFVQNFRAFKNGVEITPTQVVPNEIEALFYTTPVITIAGGTVQPVCEGDALTLDASSQLSGTTYTWNNGVVNGQPFFPQASGVYTVTAESDKGCKAISTVNVTIMPKPTITIGATSDKICLGDTVTLTAGGAAEYAWNNGQTGNVIKVVPNVGGTVKYVVTGTENTNGCSDTAVVQILVNEPPVILSTTKPVRTIAIDKNASFGVKVSGKNLEYSWQRWDGNDWVTLYNDNSDKPTINGTTTDTLELGMVPRSWNGTKLRCTIKNTCGSVDTTFLLKVKECFEILDIEWNMCEGIRPETDPSVEVDGWYCPGSKIAICAKLILEDTDIEIENPVYKWTIDGLSTDDGRWGEMTFISDSSILSWIPPVTWQDNITVALCAYVDGACDTLCKKYLRLKAQEFAEVAWGLKTSVDPSRRFCPGDTVTCWVEDNGTAGKKPTYHWYNDIFDLSKEEPTYTDVVSLKNEEVVLAMGQEDTWVRVELTPSPEICVKEPILIDTAFLRKKQVVTPNFYIDCPDTLACKGDEVAMKAVWTNAGENPSFEWQRSIGVFPDWNLGNASTATVKLDEEDVWVKCTMKPSEEVCYSDSARLIDAIQIRVLKEDGLVTITSDMKDKHPGDELTFISEVSNIIGDIRYDWYVNNNLTPEHEENYISSTLKVGDVIQCAVSGERVCQNKVFSNELIVNYGINRDTMVTIWRDETIKNMDITQPGDSPTDVWFIIVEDAKHGWASLTPTGKFRYTPNPGYVGTDYIKYWVRDKFDNTKYEEGYIYITIRDNERFFIPNLITPNNDGLNDTWKLDFLADYPDHLVTVYDRNGRVVFEARDYQNDWDGTGVAKGGYVARINLMNGVYTYVIRLNDKDKTVLKSWVEIRADLNRKSYR